MKRAPTVLAMLGPPRSASAAMQLGIMCTSICLPSTGSCRKIVNAELGQISLEVCVMLLPRAVSCPGSIVADLRAEIALRSAGGLASCLCLTPFGCFTVRTEHP